VNGRGVPTNAADFVYTPQLLPADPAERTIRVTDVGNASSLDALLNAGRLTLTITLSDTEVMLATHSAVTGFPTLVGAPTHIQAIDDDPLAPGLGYDTTTYVVGDTVGQMEMVTFAPVPFVQDFIDQVLVRGRLQAVSGTITIQPVFTSYPGGPIRNDPTRAATILAGGGFVAFAFSWTKSPFTGLNWTLDEVNNFVAGCQISAAPSIGSTGQLTQLYLTLVQHTIAPPESWSVAYWIIGPSATTPPTPLSTDAPAFVALDFTPQTANLTGTSGSIYWIWAGFLDQFGRLLRMLGPVSVTLP
jgi:hypothetical protein